MRRLGGLKFQRQRAIGPFIADFYCHAASLVVEVDGDIHLSLEAKLRDPLRSRWFLDHGIQIVRVTNEEVKYHLQVALQKILDAAMPPKAPSRDEGA